MNYIAGLLLLVTRCERSTFFLLRALAERLLPEYYGPNVPGLITDVRVFSAVLRSKSPRVHAHVESFRLPWALVCSKWFVCAFADVLPVETTLRLWDCLFAEGSKVLLRAAVALVLDPANQTRILECSEFGALAAVFKSLTVGEKTTQCHEFITVRNQFTPFFDTFNSCKFALFKVINLFPCNVLYFRETLLPFIVFSKFQCCCMF